MIAVRMLVLGLSLGERHFDKETDEMLINNFFKQTEKNLRVFNCLSIEIFATKNPNDGGVLLSKKKICLELFFSCLLLCAKVFICVTEYDVFFFDSLVMSPMDKR